MTGLLAVGLPVMVAVAVLLWPTPRTPWRPGRGNALPARAGGGRASRGEVELVAEGLDLMSLALMGGGSVAAAATSVGRVLPGELGAQLSVVGTRLEQGLDAGSAWRDAGEHWQPARQCLELAALAGVAPGEALGRAAQDLRRDAVARVDVAAARLGVLLVVPLGLAFLPAFVLTTIVPLVVSLMQDLTW